VIRAQAGALVVGPLALDSPEASATTGVVRFGEASYRIRAACLAGTSVALRQRCVSDVIGPRPRLLIELTEAGRKGEVLVFETLTELCTTITATREGRLVMFKTLARVAVLVTAITYADRAGADELFKATLSGDEEVPPVTTDTTGTALLRLNKAETEIGFQLHVNDGVGIQQAHIHCGPPGVNGPIVVFLAGLNPAGYDVDGKWVSNATITDANILDATTTCGAIVSALAESMRNGQAYANVHSVDHPAGVVRGQIETTH
jgi:hypothetical protein